MDVLYILGSESKFDNAELRYSLRSLERHLKNVGRVIVVGENPNFLSDEVEYHYIKEARGNKEYRIASKVFKACEQGIVKGDFLFMNDDFFFTKEVSANNYPYYHKDCLSLGSPNKFYKATLMATYNYLNDNGYNTLHFDVHTPIIYNSEKFLALKEHLYQSMINPFGFVVKSLYSNIYGILGEKYTDVKLGKYHDKIMDRVKSTNVISCYDGGFGDWFYDYLKETYNEKSKYEAS